MKSLEASPEAKPKLMVLGRKLVVEKLALITVLGLKPSRKARTLNVKLLLMLREMILVCNGLFVQRSMLWTKLVVPGALVGSVPSVEYQNTAPSVISLRVNKPALFPVISGLAVMNLNSAEVIGLATPSALTLTALIVMSGYLVTPKSGNEERPS